MQVHTTRFPEHKNLKSTSYDHIQLESQIPKTVQTTTNADFLRWNQSSVEQVKSLKITPL